MENLTVNEELIKMLWTFYEEGLYPPNKDNDDEYVGIRIDRFIIKNKRILIDFNTEDMFMAYSKIRDFYDLLKRTLNSGGYTIYYLVMNSYVIVDQCEAWLENDDFSFSDTESFYVEKYFYTELKELNEKRFGELEDLTKLRHPQKYIIPELP